MPSVLLPPAKLFDCRVGPSGFVFGSNSPVYCFCYVRSCCPSLRLLEPHRVLIFSSFEFFYRGLGRRHTATPGNGACRAVKCCVLVSIPCASCATRLLVAISRKNRRPLMLPVDSPYVLYHMIRIECSFRWLVQYRHHFVLARTSTRSFSAVGCSGTFLFTLGLPLRMNPR